MKTLIHPNMRDTSIEVDDDKVAAYVAQGWRDPSPKKASEPATTTNTRSSATGEDKKKEG